MSRNINVNPAHYKVAGRERQGEGIIQEAQKQAYTTQQADAMGDGVPPWEATRHSFVSAQPPEPAPAKKTKKTRKSAAKRRTSQASRPAARKTARKTKRAKKPVRASNKPARRRVAARSTSRARRVKRSTRRR